MGSTAEDMQGIVKCSSLNKTELELSVRNRHVNTSQPLRLYGLVTAPLGESGDTTGKGQLLILPLGTLRTKYLFNTTNML